MALVPRHLLVLISAAVLLAGPLASATRHSPTAAFPFSIQAGGFARSGTQVFLHIIGYQPLEPGQAVDGQINALRIDDDLRRLRAFQGGNNPVVLRVYAQPTVQFPNRMPKSFYDGIRALDFWVVRDIYFDPNFTASDAIAKGQSAIDAVIAEVSAADAFDRIFAWELANEFEASGANIAILENFLLEMRNHIKQRMAEPGRELYSHWVTWTSWPPSDPLRTGCSPGPSGCNPIGAPQVDYISFNAYSYDPERMRDQQAAPGTGTPYAGYLAALKARFPNTPVVISETGLPDSPSAVGLDQARIPPTYPSYRRGALTSEQVAEGLRDRYWDARLSGAVAGFGVFEWADEWWKAGNPATHDSDPEEHFGLSRFTGTASPQLRFKIQQETIRDLFTMRLPAPTPVLSAVTADALSLPATGSTTVRATVAAGAVQPVRFRWESNRGRVVGESDTVQFHAAGAALGPAVISAVATDRLGNATHVSVSIAIQSGIAATEILTFGTSRSSGRVMNVDLTANKIVLYVRTNQYYAQPFADMQSIWIRADGYWWSPNFAPNTGGQLYAWVVPNAFDPPATMASPPPTIVAEAVRIAINDADNDLLPDTFEPSVGHDRYHDSDGDAASHLDELLNGTNPSVADNDSDGDGLQDTWERLYFGALDYAASSDTDGDGLFNSQEQAQQTHPGRANVDADTDGLPDLWEMRRFGDLSHEPTTVDAYGITNLNTYELGVLLFTDDILTPGATAIRVVHVTDMRERVDALRSRFGLAAFPWTDPTLTAGAPVRTAHINDLRMALAAAYAQAGRTVIYPTDPVLVAGMTIKAAHIQDIRTAIIALE